MLWKFKDDMLPGDLPWTTVLPPDTQLEASRSATFEHWYARCQYMIMPKALGRRTSAISMARVHISSGFVRSIDRPVG